MRSSKINLEKLKILASGIIDGGRFNDHVRNARKLLNIPEDGFKDNEQVKEWEQWRCEESDRIMSSKQWNNKLSELSKLAPRSKEYKNELENINAEVPINLMGILITKILKNTLDLSANFHSTIFWYIIWGEKAQWATPGNFSIKVVERNGKKVPSIEIYGPMTKAEQDLAYRSAEIMARGWPDLKPKANIDRDIKIVQLSQKKGNKLESKCPDLEPDGSYSDANVVEELFRDSGSPEDLNKQESIIRKRRSLIEKRARKLFPKMYSSKPM